PESIKSCGVLKAPPARITSRVAWTDFFSPGFWLIAVRLVKPFAFEILDADRSIFFVEKHLGRERVELDGQIAGIFLLDLQQKFARAVPSALGCGQRRQAKSDRVIL